MISRIDDLNTEVNHRKIQVASLFTSIQQVETEIRKEQETTQQHNRDKALSNLRKARFMKQMQNLTKELKQKTILTHSFPMPKPTNTTELTKKLPDDSPDEILIPDIMKDLHEQLTKLGLNITPLTNTKSETNKQTLEDMTQCKLFASPSSTSTPPEKTTIASIKIEPCKHKDVEQCETTHEYEHTKELPSQNSSQLLEEQKYELSQPTRDTSNGAQPEEDILDSSTAIKPLKLSHSDHIEAYPWAHNASRNFSIATPLAEEDQEVEFINMKYRSLPKYLTSQQREQMKQVITLTEVAMQRIDKHIGIKRERNKKKFFCKVCDSTSPFQHQKRSRCKRHVKIHLGYSVYRCSFCNFISNNATSVCAHYMCTHGIPKVWIPSD